MVILKVDIDKNQQLASDYQVVSVPTGRLFKNGKLKWRHSDGLGANEWKQIIRAEI